MTILKSLLDLYMTIRKNVINKIDSHIIINDNGDDENIIAIIKINSSNDHFYHSDELWVEIEIYFADYQIEVFIENKDISEELTDPCRFVNELTLVLNRPNHKYQSYVQFDWVFTDKEYSDNLVSEIESQIKENIDQFSQTIPEQDRINLVNEKLKELILQYV